MNSTIFMKILFILAILITSITEWRWLLFFPFSYFSWIARWKKKCVYCIFTSQHQYQSNEENNSANYYNHNTLVLFKTHAVTKSILPDILCNNIFVLFFFFISSSQRISCIIHLLPKHVSHENFTHRLRYHTWDRIIQS